MAVNTTGATTGATFVAPDVRGDAIIKPLQATSVVLSSGPKVYFSQGLPLKLPKISSVAIADPYRAELEQISTVDPTLGEVTLLPSNLKSVKILTKLSNESIRHAVASESMDSLLADAFSERIALIYDRDFLLGAGTADGNGNITPKGLANQTGVQSVTSVGSLTIDKMYDALLLALNANAKFDSLAWYMNARDWVTLKKSKSSGGGDYLYQPDQSEAGRPSLFGIPIFITSQMPTNQGSSPANKSTVILADRQQFAVGIDENVRIDFLDQFQGDYDAMTVRLVARLDIAALNPEGIVVMTGVQP